MNKIRGRRKCECGQFYKQDLHNCPYCGALDAFSDLVLFDPTHWIYDIESYPNVFTCTAKNVSTGTYKRFEISERKNDLPDFIVFMNNLSDNRCSMIGFNNIGYDYPVIHHIDTFSTYESIYRKSMSIINTEWNDRFSNQIPVWHHVVKQIDLFLIHHFDNTSKSTSLKMLEFNMRRDNVSDLPFPPGTILTNDQIDILIDYNDDDVDNTEAFYFESLEAIEYRASLGEEFTNYNDTKIGKKYFETQLENASPGVCRIGNRPRQTIRPYIDLNDAVLPYIKFERPEFQATVDYLKSQVITETKGVFKDLSAVVDGLKYDFGTGGLHASIESQIVKSGNGFTIYDWDVKSYYPNTSIANKLFPEHLGELFCEVYEALYIERSNHPKGSTINSTLKLALNGVFGDSNNPYSPFYDPLYTMSITINGQLLLCVLAEQLLKIPQLRMIQCNTDGLTVLCPDHYIDHMKKICKWWEDFTLMELEHAIYSRMFIRDVNNYIAEKTDGKLKNKGTYAHITRMEAGSKWSPDNGIDWHQNHSGLIVPKAVEKYFIENIPVEYTIFGHKNIHDFTYCTKVKGKDRLEFSGKEVQRTCRYIVTKNTGGKLVKISPPTEGYQIGQWKRKNGISNSYYETILNELQTVGYDLDSTGTPWDERINTKNKSKYDNRNTKIFGSRLITVCNDINDARFEDIDYDHYIQESYKLIKPLIGENNGY